MKFIADEMLKRLAKWLRLFGIETAYSIGKSDDEIIAIAQQHDYIILTRDEKLERKARKYRAPCCLIRNNNVVEQLLEIKRAAGMKIEFPEKTFCPICGEELRRVGKEEVRQLVEENVLKEKNEFWLCGKCNKAYWIGSHWKNINNVLNIIKNG